MVIGVDAGALSTSDDRLKVGVYRVTKHALAALSKIDAKNHYRLYTFGAIEEGITQGFGSRAEVVQLPRRAWQRVWLPIELKKRPVDAFLGFTQALPSVSTLYDIGFVYDLGFLYRPDVYGAAAATLKKQTDTLVKRADHIITISQASKVDIQSEYGLPSETVTVAYPGVDPTFSPVGEKYTGTHPYFLFVGSLNKAKDIPCLIHEFAGLCEKNTTHDLVLIGGDYWPDPAIEETIGKLHLKDRVIKIGFVPDDALPKYYRGATALVTTALHEGFCLPAAEAMACGTPVVALERGALREVVGEGGIIIRATCNVQRAKTTLAEAMIKMTNKKTRAGFVKKAIVQAKKFRWGVFARQVLEQITNYTR